jgi:hypothetical protein
LVDFPTLPSGVDLHVLNFKKQSEVRPESGGWDSACSISLYADEQTDLAIRQFVYKEAFKINSNPNKLRQFTLTKSEGKYDGVLPKKEAACKQTSKDPIFT